MNWVELWAKIPGGTVDEHPTMNSWPWSGSVVYVDRNHMEFDGVFSTVNVPVNAYRQLHAWHSASIEGGTVHGNGNSGGEADIAARRTVHITGEFHAEEGSETHIHLQETFPDCNSSEFRSMQQSPSISSGNAVEPNKVPPELTLSFLSTAEPVIRIEPNPTTDLLSIFNGPLGGRYEVRSLSGNLVLSGPVQDQVVSTVDVSTLPSAEYLISVVIGTDQQVFKFTKVR